MRISNAFALDASLSQLQRRQTALAQSQEQLTSGKRVLKPSDDPAAAAAAERAYAKLQRAESQGRALDASRNAMKLTESALGDAGELLQQARETIINAGNGAMSDSERQTLANTLRGLRNDLLGVANRSDGSGHYLFGGQGSDTLPFTESGAGVVYSGVAGQISAPTSEPSPMSFDGRNAFMGAPNPANPGSALSVFDTLDATIAALSTPGQSGTQIGQVVADGIAGVDAVTAQINGARSVAGQALNRLDGIESRLSQTKIDGETERSTAEDLDPIAAISDFQTQQTGYSAALQAYSLVQRMSLFDYLK
jgi:flagellar hook-associated protein 3 FlgL